MGTKILAVAAIALCPAIALSQGRYDTTAKATGQRAESTSGAARQDTTGKNVTTTSTGAVAPENAAGGKASGDPKMIGTPAWWSTHSTADGKPLSAAANAKPQRSDSSRKNKKP